MRHLMFVPIFLLFLGETSIWTVFTISVFRETVNITEVFPFISECAFHPPQSCMFDQVCSLIVASVLCIGLIRYHHVKHNGQHGKVNIASGVLILLTCAGLSVSTNFQEMAEVHLAGSLVSFVSTIFYFWVQVHLTRQLKTFEERYWLLPTRAVNAAVATALGACFVVFHSLDSVSGAAACEFALVMVIFFNYGLFAVEFRHLECDICIVQQHLPKIEDDFDHTKVNMDAVKTLS